MKIKSNGIARVLKEVEKSIVLPKWCTKHLFDCSTTNMRIYINGSFPGENAMLGSPTIRASRYGFKSDGSLYIDSEPMILTSCTAKMANGALYIDSPVSNSALKCGLIGFEEDVVVNFSGGGIKSLLCYLKSFVLA